MATWYAASPCVPDRLGGHASSPSHLATVRTRRTARSGAETLGRQCATATTATAAAPRVSASWASRSMSKAGSLVGQRGVGCPTSRNSGRSTWAADVGERDPPGSDSTQRVHDMTEDAGVDLRTRNARDDHQQQSPGSGAISACNRRNRYFPRSERTWQPTLTAVGVNLSGAPASADVACSKVQSTALAHVLTTPYAFFVSRGHGRGQAFIDHRAAVAHRFRGGDLLPRRPGVPHREEQSGSASRQAARWRKSLTTMLSSQWSSRVEGLDNRGVPPSDKDCQAS